MFIWRTLKFKKKTPEKNQKKSSSPASTPSSSRLLRSRSIHHSKCFDYEVSDDLAAHYHAMNNSSSNEMGSYHSESPPLSHESPQHPSIQETCRSCGSISGKDSIGLEAPCETAPGNLSAESELPYMPKNRDAATHHSKEFLDFLELFNAHRELFLKILHDPSLLATAEQQGETSSSGAVPLNRLESFPRPGGSSGKRNPIFDRSDSEKSRKSELQKSPSRPNNDVEAAKVISTRMPSGVDGSAVSLSESRSLKKSGTASNRFKAIGRKIKDVVKENRKELARITKDGVFHRLPYGQKMSELTRSPSTEKFVHEEKQIRRSYSIAEYVEKYSTLYESISRDSKVSPERSSITMGGNTSLKAKKPPLGFKRITSLPEMRLYSPHQGGLTEISDSQIEPKTCIVESDCLSSHRTDAFSIYEGGNFYPDDVTERSGNIHSEINYGGKAKEEEVYNIVVRESDSYPLHIDARVDVSFSA